VDARRTPNWPRVRGASGPLSGTVGAVAQEEIGERLIRVLSEFESIAGGVTPEEAARSLDDPTLQVFWRDWPNIGSWAGALWRNLSQDLASPARPPQDPERDEVGGSG
jgi:hypothetical protein